MQNHKNIIGSLQGDVQKLNRARHDLEERIKRLRVELGRQTALQKKTTSELQSVIKSASWKTGYVTVKAFKKPGVHTLLLPFRLLKILVSHSRLNKTMQKTDPPSRLNSAPAPEPLSTPEQHSKRCTPFPLRKAITPDTLSELRVVCIVDEFTYNCFKPECNLLQLSPADWQQEIEPFKPDLLFVEAAWRGKNDLWTGKIEKVSNEIKALILWCRKHGIPTVFWAKEDPFSFKTFFPTARLFDFIYTSDKECIQQYKDIDPDLEVTCLPFAAQPAVHNPIEKYQRKDKFCFAGSYYNRFPARQQDFETFFDTLTGLKPVDIFDRNYRVDQNLFIFPDKYKSSIIGNLPHDQIDKAYKGYRYAINMNSIKDSKSMFARRVFELLASNTVIVSNYSKGIHSFFGDLVISTDDDEILRKRLAPLLNDDVYYQKFRLLGLRRVLKEHTYEDRLAYMVSKIWGIQPKGFPHVQVLAKASDTNELKLILASYERQSYANKSLLVVCEDFQNAKYPADDTICIYAGKTARSKTIEDIADNGFIAGFSSHDYYGPNYLLDNILATRYSEASVIGKGARFKENENLISLHKEDSRYSYVEELPLRSCIFRATLRSDEGLTHFLEQLQTGTIHSKNCLSIDEFNYCQNSTKSTCSAVDDLQQIDCGLPMSQILVADLA